MGKVTLWAVTTILVLACLEGLSFAAGKVLQSKWAMWSIPRTPAGDSITFADYMARRDPVLGWPYPEELGENLELSGAQRNPLFPHFDHAKTCVSLYGDSFTEGGDYSHPKYRWGAILSGKMGCDVANYGVGGYGTDQAYLRYLGNELDRSPLVVFGIHPADVTRNLTRMRDLEVFEQWYSLKPRYIIDDSGALKLIPIPELTEEEYLRVIGAKQPFMLLENESFQPGGPAGVVRLSFPYTLSVLQNMLRYHGFRVRVLRYPEWKEFLDPQHALGGLSITVRITQGFVEAARARGSTPLVIILPHPVDFEYFSRRGSWAYGALADELYRKGIPVIDFGPELLEISADDPAGIESYFGPSRHYNDKGNAAVAGFVFKQIKTLAIDFGHFHEANVR